MRGVDDRTGSENVRVGRDFCSGLVRDQFESGVVGREVGERDGLRSNYRVGVERVVSQCRVSLMSNGGLHTGLMGLRVGLVNGRGRVGMRLGYGLGLVVEGETVECAPRGGQSHLLLSCWWPLVERVAVCVDVSWSRGNVVVNGVSGITETVKRIGSSLMGRERGGTGYGEYSRMAGRWFIWERGW